MVSEGQKITPGMKLASRAYEIEPGMVQQFVRAVGDSNPLWQEIVPPTFVVTLGLEQVQEVLAQVHSATSLHGSTDLECYQDIHAGDTITMTTTVENVRERQGKMGKTSFITFEIAYENQRKEIVARCRQMIINY